MTNATKEPGVAESVYRYGIRNGLYGLTECEDFNEVYREDYDRGYAEGATRRLVPVWLANDTTVLVPRDLVARFVGVDADGDLVVTDPTMGDDWPYALTPCCFASGKGGGHGVICRACYTDVDFKFGTKADVAIPKLVLG